MPPGLATFAFLPSSTSTFCPRCTADNGTRVSAMSRHDLVERPGHAGYPVETPLAQALGPFSATLAFAVLEPRTASTIGAIERLADDLLHPLAGETLRTAIDPPQVVEGIDLSGDGLALSTIKPSEDGSWTILRCVNLLDLEVAGRWHLRGVREARLGRLDETPLGALAVTDGMIAFEAPPRGVVTVLAR